MADGRVIEWGQLSVSLTLSSDVLLTYVHNNREFKYLVFLNCVLWVRYSSEHFLCVSSFNPHVTPRGSRHCHLTFSVEA